MSNFALKLKLVLWKNFIIRKRHYILSTFEILMSVFIFAMLSYSRTLIPDFNKVVINETEYNAEKFHNFIQLKLLYTPNHKSVENFMMETAQLLPHAEMYGFTTENDMDEWMQAYADNQTESYFMKPIGVVFEKFPVNSLPKNLKYLIRTDSSISVQSLFDYSEPFQSYSKNYYFDTFLQTQQALDVAFIKQQKQTVPNFDFEIKFQEMPYPPRTETGQLISLFLTVLPSCTILAFVLVFPSVLKRVIEEKSTGIKELMKMMGLDAWMLWLGWFIHSMVSNIIAITFIVIMLKVGVDTSTSPIIEYGDAFIIWIFLFLYCSAGICFCFFISTPFKKPTLGMCVGIMIWVVSFFIVSPLVMNDDPNAYTFLRYFVMILPNVCLIYGFKALSEFERKETGLTWSHFLERPNEYTPHPSMAFVFLMLIIDCIIFLIFTWYIENVFPGEYGIARPWYYPFTKSYWCTNKVTTSDGHLSHIEERDGVEPVPADLSAGVQIRNLSKSFQKKPAVDDLSFDIYDNQITVLLGHNGAGKTTTMNIITGMISPNSGTVVVNGFNIQSNINKVRESLGLCPQHNLQFSDLTVLEHLMFFAMLKGLSKAAAKLESEQFLSRLNISSKANKMASELSGGMRRKLSLGMALVGHTRVLMLDEPTSGMDPEARREIWDFLLSMRGERTILITTHYMEEADILGDRIAIMHHGQLMCYGTSLFLKKHYGTGYTLSLLVTNSWNINTITEAIQNIIPSATVKSISAGCVNFVLPTNDTTALSALFMNLEMHKSELSISNFGVSLTTMEEVFLRVGEIAEEADKSTGKNSETDSEQYLLTDASVCDPGKDLVTGPFLLYQQFLGLFIKRFQYSIRRWMMFLLQVLIPLALVMFIMITMKMSENKIEPDVRRDMVLNSYAKSESFFSFNDTKMAALGEMYAQTVKSQNGIVSEVNSVSDAIVKVGVTDLDRYHRTLIASAEFNMSGPMWVLNAMYGDWALHGPPISLNLITNAVLKTVTGDASRQIAVVNNPWPEFKSKSQVNVNLSAIIMWMFQFPVAFTIMVGFFLIFPQEERLTGVKHLQLMAGVPRALYWASIYLYDLLVYIAVGVLVIIILISFDNGGPFGNGPSLQALSSLMFLYGFGILPFSYIFTYRPTASSSMTFLIWIQVLFGTIATVVVIVLDTIGDDYKKIGEGLSYLFYFVPNFAFSNGIFKYISHAGLIYTWDNMDPEQQAVKCQFSLEPCCDSKSVQCKEFYSYYAGEYSITINIIYLVVHIFLYSFVLLFIDSGMPRKYIEQLLDMHKEKVGDDPNLDQDVAEEKQRIKNQINETTRRKSAGMENGVTHLQKDVLQVTNLRKYFRRFYAVRGLNFGVKSSECFGLLGINGAGKTTTFKMLTGEMFPTAGTANLMGYRLDGDQSTYLKKIGYCPQFDALNLTLSCREMLQLFAYLRGIPSHKIQVHVRKWINKFGIKQYENIRCGNLSGGNKRKLSTAVALIGNPPLVMLDEPTSGVDPVARRNLWDILSELRKSGQSIILTSHSMDECEALCDRLAIMVDGQMKCIGNIQHLKSKYGQGFTVMMKLRAVVALTGDVTDSVNEIGSLKRTIESKYSCTLKDEHTGMLLYHVTNSDAKLGEVFQFLEGLKTNVEILEDYTVCDTSLEQVFLSFAKDKIKDVGTVDATAEVTAAIV